MSNQKTGRPPYKPTDEDRQKVHRMSRLGTSHEQIALVMGIRPPTLRKHFRQDLDNGAIEANLEVADTLFKMATSGKQLGATLFWARTRNRFCVEKPEPPAPPPPPAPPVIKIINNDGAPLATD